MPTVDRVPVHILAGFLGSGKTTLLNRVLSESHGERIAVVVNEFGDVGVDGRLVVGTDEEVIELANGCVCCTVRGDLSRTVGDLLRRRRRKLFRAAPFERLLVEASGLADPGPVLQTFVLDSYLAAETQPAGVTTLINVTSAVGELERHPECERQIGYADLLLLNHSDRASEAEILRVEAELRRRNPLALMRRTVRAEIDVRELLELRARPFEEQLGSGAGGHVHSPRASSVVLRTKEPLELAGLKMWLQFLANRRGHSLWRIKGILACRDHPGPVVVQGVYQWLELGPAEGETPDESVLVLIGQDLDREELERGFAAVLAR